MICIKSKKKPYNPRVYTPKKLKKLHKKVDLSIQVFHYICIVRNKQLRKRSLKMAQLKRQRKNKSETIVSSTKAKDNPTKLMSNH